jgi:hypothetical protein
VIRNSLFILLVLTYTVVCGQLNRHSEDKIIADILERFIENEESLVDYTDLQEQLEYYSNYKLNLNKATRAQLSRLVFLDESDINAIIVHRTKNGPFLSIFELQAITTLNEQKRHYLSYFGTITGDLLDDLTPFRQMPFLGKHEIFVMHDQEIQQRAGYDEEKRINNQIFYQGPPNRFVTRYRFAYSNKLYFGYTGEKDKGEPWFNEQIQTIDFNSFHFFYRPSRSAIKSIALGDYQVNFGQGLVFGSGIAGRKSAFVMSVKRSYLTLRPYRSLNENEFLRGAAAIIQSGNFEFTPFISTKYVSTNLKEPEDPLQLQEGGFSNIQLSGLHRTQTELRNRYNVFQSIGGGNIAWVKDDNRVGITCVHTQYSRPFIPTDRPYQIHNFVGNTLTNAGVDYTLQLRNLSLFGEVGYSSNQSMAITSGLVYPLDPRLDVIFVYRNFSPRYQTTFVNPFAENSDARNEQGIYSGLSFKINRRWSLNMYIDMYRSPWMRFVTDGPSHGNDVLAELSHTFSRNASMYFRCRTETKWRNQPNNTSPTDYLTPHSRTQYRWHSQYTINVSWVGRSRMELITYQDEMSRLQTGTLMFQDLEYSTPMKNTKLIARLAVFNVESFNARIFATESDVLYQYSVPLFQNNGVRYYILLHQRINRKVDFWIRISETIYSNMSSISSGLQKINGNRLSEVRMQLRFTF